MTYTIIKHSHMLMAVLSIFLLVFRFILQTRKSQLLTRKWLKILPHVIDTILLLTAIGLMIIIQQYPFQAPWITEKLFAVIAYILTGFMALKWLANPMLRLFAFILSLGWVGLILHLATTKQAIFLS